jgi:hypothetical protein
MASIQGIGRRIGPRNVGAEKAQKRILAEVPQGKVSSPAKGVPAHRPNDELGTSGSSSRT